MITIITQILNGEEEIRGLPDSYLRYAEVKEDPRKMSPLSDRALVRKIARLQTLARMREDLQNESVLDVAGLRAYADLLSITFVEAMTSYTPALVSFHCQVEAETLRGLILALITESIPQYRMMGCHFEVTKCGQLVGLRQIEPLQRAFN